MNNANPSANYDCTILRLHKLWCSGSSLLSGAGTGKGDSCGNGLLIDGGDGSGRTISSGCGNVFKAGSGKGVNPNPGGAYEVS